LQHTAAARQARVNNAGNRQAQLNAQLLAVGKETMQSIKFVYCFAVMKFDFFNISVMFIAIQIKSL
jgi:hypothetical protein